MKKFSGFILGLILTTAAWANSATTASQETLSSPMPLYGWEISTNILGYTLSPIASQAFGLSIVDISVAAHYALTPEHMVGLEPSMFILNPSSGADINKLVTGASNISIFGMGFAPLYRWVESGFDKSSTIFGVRIPFKFLTLDTYQSGTNLVGKTSFAMIQFLAELGYRFKWDRVTLTPAAYVGYRLLTLDNSFVVGNVTHTLGSQIDPFKSGLGFGAQLSLGVAF
jgi:hypothetical protein